jgi:hypothetical protein
MQRLTFQDIVNDKRLTAEERRKDLNTLIKFSAESNERKFCGNGFLYHYQMANLCKTKARGKDSLYDKMMDDEKYATLYSNTMKLKRTGTLANRIFEAERFNGPVVFFKPSTAKWLYKKFGATSVLDWTAGWGGRMLGAYALGIAYRGIDTNVAMKPAYDEMITELGRDNLEMIWDSCLNVDFSTLDYDMVLTSPPYINLEVYEHMTPFESTKAFYEKFLIPMITKSLKHIKEGGKVCINISPKMYQELLEFGFRKCDEEYDLLQQKRIGKDKQDKIYVWISPTRTPL